MRKLKLIIATFLILGPMSVSADPILLTATSTDSGFGDFTVLFDDTGGGLLQWDEILSFSGINVPVFSQFDDLLFAIPTISGISSFSFDPNLVSIFGTPVDGSWRFAESAALDHLVNCPADCFTYSLSVPEPGTLALLGIGLFGMGLARRNKKV